jgi:predicted GIY-YIG superfamily endonuclease
MNTMPTMVHRDAFTGIYAMSNRKPRTLCISVTSNLVRRTGRHGEGSIGGFTKKSGLQAAPLVQA